MLLDTKKNWLLSIEGIPVIIRFKTHLTKDLQITPTYRIEGIPLITRFKTQ